MKLQFHTRFVRITLVVLQLINPSLQWPEPEYSSAPIPAPWPEQFHALLYMNLSSTRLQITNLWYDWPRSRNVNIIQKQLSVLLYDTEWNNGTTFYYTLSEPHSCRIMVNDVGIPRPDFLDGAEYLGTAVTDGYLCNVWEKIDTIWYYEDVYTKRPVRWDFNDGISTHVITFEVGAVLSDDSVTQAPAYCFNQEIKNM
ncbi:hypothetical protein H0E87_029440 [Populus deltoides]|uniref:Uncharacterized protein n=1 Tax=Populus deltoides TaxID=3696 RepID=A0A8T2WMI0_POPDE|nr:hypothetical protein H0E87_029440 [Populus deltoides]